MPSAENTIRGLIRVDRADWSFGCRLFAAQKAAAGRRARSGRVTEYEVLCDAIKSELLSIDDKGAGAQNAFPILASFLVSSASGVDVWSLCRFQGRSDRVGDTCWRVLVMTKD